MTTEPLFLRALNQQRVERPPVWMLRQAGRYLPEYRALRQQTPDFTSFCYQSELTCQAALMPLKRFDLDAAIVFSDILVIPDAMGMELTFSPGPRFKKSIEHGDDIQQLSIPAHDQKLLTTGQSIALLKREMPRPVPVIGFSGAPWTLAAYMLSGGQHPTFVHSKRFLHQQPQAAHQLMSKLSAYILDYCLMQINYGADAIMLFDSWAGLLDEHDYRLFCLPYLEQIYEKLRAAHPHIPTILFAKEGGRLQSQLVTLPINALGIDWQTSLAETQKQQHLTIQGNFDPSMLFYPEEVIVEKMTAVLDNINPYQNYIANLGHGIMPETPIAGVEAFVRTIRQLEITDDHRTSVAQ